MSGYDKRPDEGSGAYIERLIRERDEAIALLRAAQKERDAVADQHEQECDRLECERDEAILRVSELSRECGQLQAQLAHVQQQLARMRVVAEERCPELMALSDWYDLFATEGGTQASGPDWTELTRPRGNAR